MKRKEILIADRDSIFILTALNSLIYHYELRIAYSRKEVHQKVQEKMPYLIIIGSLEPRGDSYTLHRELRDNINTKHIPLLIIDADPNDFKKMGWNKSEGMNMTAEGYLTRPVDQEELNNEVQRIIRMTMKKNQIVIDAMMNAEKEMLDNIEKWKEMMSQRFGTERIYKHTQSY